MFFNCLYKRRDFIEKIFLVLRREFAIKDLILKSLHYFVIYAFVCIPCFCYFFSFPAWGNVGEGVIKTPYLFKVVIPRFEYSTIVASIPDIVAKEDESVGEFSFSRGVSAVPVKEPGTGYAQKGSNKSRKKISWFHFFLSTLVGAVLGVIVGTLGFLVAIGHLEWIFTVAFLEKMKVPKCLYWYRSY